MFHLGLACNILSAIGGTPQILAAVPTYPGPLPGDVRPQLTVYLGTLFSLQGAAEELLNIPLSGGDGSYGPEFRWEPRSGYRHLRALQTSVVPSSRRAQSLQVAAGVLRGDPAAPDFRYLDAQRAQLLERVHELAVLLDLSILEQE